jgi:hypothetical protein
MPNLELAQKTHDLLYYLENPRIYDSGKVSLEPDIVVCPTLLNMYNYI